MDLFGAAGEHLTYPDAPVTLYRGVRDEHGMRRMSWTASLNTARWFANRFGSGRVYQIVDIDPEHVLARITRGRDEDEYVLDPEYIDDAPIEMVEV
jgi:hypothetical protein